MPQEFPDAICRACWRCKAWLPLTYYRPNAHLCALCEKASGSRGSVPNKALGLRAVVRGYRLTDKGRAAIREWEAAE